MNIFDELKYTVESRSFAGGGFAGGGFAGGGKGPGPRPNKPKKDHPMTARFMMNYSTDRVEKALSPIVYREGGNLTHIGDKSWHIVTPDKSAIIHVTDDGMLIFVKIDLDNGSIVGAGGSPLKPNAVITNFKKVEEAWKALDKVSDNGGIISAFGDKIYDQIRSFF